MNPNPPQKHEPVEPQPIDNPKTKTPIVMPAHPWKRKKAA